LPAAAPIAIPAIIAAVRNDDPFAREHAIEALNFQITMWVAAFVAAALTCVLVGFVMLAVVAVVGLVMPIFAMMAASRGEVYRYPFTVRLFS
jgi:hypothetical protein